VCGTASDAVLQLPRLQQCLPRTVSWSWWAARAVCVAAAGPPATAVLPARRHTGRTGTSRCAKPCRSSRSSSDEASIIKNIISIIIIISSSSSSSS